MDPIDLKQLFGRHRCKIPPWPEPEPMVRDEILFLGGGNSNISYFHPVNVGR